MKKIGAGQAIYDLRRRIQKARSDIESLGEHEDLPELVSSANLLRSNEHLLRANQKRDELLSVYSQYCEILEEMLLTTLEIQDGLREVLKRQSSMIPKKGGRRQRARKR